MLHRKNLKFPIIPEPKGLDDKEIEMNIFAFLSENPNGVLEILGATGSGKTTFSIELAKKIETKTDRKVEILSVDSRQIYNEGPIASNKITTEEMQEIPHFGLDLISPTENFSVVAFQEYAFQKIEEILSRGSIPILCGGTMLWLDAVSENYKFNEKGEKSTEKLNPKWEFLKVGLSVKRTTLYEKLDRRSAEMLQEGLVEETKYLRQKYGENLSRGFLTSFGYGEVLSFLEGHINEYEMIKKLQQRNRNYAKKQLTWWRGRTDVLWKNKN